MARDPKTEELLRAEPERLARNAKLEAQRDRLEKAGVVPTFEQKLAAAEKARKAIAEERRPEREAAHAEQRRYLEARAKRLMKASIKADQEALVAAGFAPETTAKGKRTKR